MKCIAVVGVGYVGLQCVKALADAGLTVIGYDINRDRIHELQNENDSNAQVQELGSPSMQFTSILDDIAKANIYLITVPTPVKNKKPDLSPLAMAVDDIGSLLKAGDLVICESTVAPGTTEEFILPRLEDKSGLKAGDEFLLGFSSERVDFGQTIQQFSRTNKVYAGINHQSSHLMKALYTEVIEADLVEASSVKVAEASKLLENIQHDVNIALMNEFSEVMDSLGICATDVIGVASTKWNFIPFQPGFVGGHCIPVDPYYLIDTASKNAVDVPFIREARKANDHFLNYFYDKIVALTEIPASVGLLGLSFKKNIPDTRNSLAIDLYHKLVQQGYTLQAVDPLATGDLGGINRVNFNDLKPVDVLVVCVDHDEFMAIKTEDVESKLKAGGCVIDIPILFDRQQFKRSLFEYWVP